MSTATAIFPAHEALAPSHITPEEIAKALQLFGGNKSMVAEYLGISQTTLWRRLKRLQSGECQG